MRITKGTVIRAILLLGVVSNQILKAVGKPIIIIDEGTVAATVEMVVEVAVIVVAYWKNNSWSVPAIKADEFLSKLKEGENKDD